MGYKNSMFNRDCKCQHMTQYLMKVFTAEQRTECVETVFKNSTSWENFPQW